MVFTWPEPVRVSVGINSETFTLSSIMDDDIFDNLVSESITSSQSSLGNAISWINAQLNARGLSQLLRTNPPIFMPSLAQSFNQGAVALIASSGVTPQVLNIGLGENREIFANLPGGGLIVIGETAVTGDASMHNKFGYTQAVSPDFPWPNCVGPFACSNAIVGTSRYPENFGLWIVIYPDCTEHGKLSYEKLASSDFAFVYMAYDQYSHRATLTIEFGGRNTETIPEELAGFLLFNQIPIDRDDPYGPGGNSGTGGGGGTFDLESDVIGLPPLPTLSFAATGFTRIYNPTLAELNSLANYLWTDQTFLDTVINHLKQLLENPMDAIISLSILPCPIPNGSSEAVKVMYINTGVYMSPATTQFVDVDCGTYTLEEFYGSALDYNPYTKVHCYLPFIGQVTLDTDEVMGKTLRIIYRIDIVTGMCSAMISVTSDPEMDINILYQFSGHCSINMPINSADFSGYIGAAMTAGKMVAGVVAGAAGAPALAAELIGAPAPHSSTSETIQKDTVRNPTTGRQITSGTSRRTTTRNTPGASFGEMARKAASNTVSAVMGSKLTVEHAGGFTGNSGYLAVRRPYLIIERPRMCNPEEYGKYNGRPSMIYMSLGSCVGYTEVQSIQFENIPATNPELAELSELLKSGVLF